MSNTVSSTSLFPTKVLQTSDRLKQNPRRRNGFERISYTKDQFIHAYRGMFVRDNMHGLGQYCCLNNNSKNTLYDGQFYCNNLEGYATLTASNGEYFEGLYKDNHKFGPGVLTYGNKTQDVGLWIGDRLVRLSVIVQPEIVPKLANTTQGKSRLLEHRQLIPLEQLEVASKFEVLLKNVGANDVLLQQYQRICNKSCRDKNSVLFDSRLYDQKFFGRKDNFINVVLSDADILASEEAKLKKQMDEELLKSDVRYIVEEIIEDLPDKVMLELGEPSKTEEFAEELINEAIFNIDDLLERAVEERDLIYIRNTYRRQLQENYSNCFNKEHTKSIEITHLVSWNNEPTSIELLKHSFLHRNLENNVCFNVCRVLSGDRSDFYATGVKESKNIDFLVGCCQGLTDEVSDLVLNCHIDVCVVDARGNCGIMYAASKDKLEMIQLLTNFGAKLDCVNDEHLTALNMCLLRYLAVKYSIRNWERAFLINQNSKQANNFERDTCFKPNSSLFNILSQVSLVEPKPRQKPLPKIGTSPSDLNVISMTDLLSKLEIVRYQDSIYEVKVDGSEERYVFENTLVKPVVRPTSKSKKSKRKVGKSKESSKKSKKTKSTKGSSSRKTTTSRASTKDEIALNQLQAEMELKTKNLDQILGTILVLLHYGAKPYVCNIPMPPIHLGIYTQHIKLVEELLKHGCSPSSTIEETNASALHVLCSLPTSKDNYDMFRTLLCNGADVNAKTNESHWPEERALIIGSYIGEIEDNGKNALHILSLRYDFDLDEASFIYEMATDLIQNKIDLSDLYLGHSAISLAVLRGNLIFLERLIKYFDINQVLGNNMGTALMVPILKRYYDIIPYHKGKAIVDLLIFNGVNPLEAIGDFTNAISFIKQEYAVAVIGTKGKDKGKLKQNSKKGSKSSKKAKKSKTNTKSSKKSKKSKSTGDTEEIKKYLIKTSKDILIKHVQIDLVNFLLDYVAHHEEFNEFTENVVKFINIQETKDIIQQLLILEQIKPCNCFQEYLVTLFQYINKINPIIRVTKQKTSPKTVDDLLNEINYEKQLPDDMEKVRKLPQFSRNEEIFKICFQCLQKVNKELYSCTNCGVVSFCSEACNKADVKAKSSKHKCRILYYNSVKEKLKYGEVLENKYMHYQNKFNETKKSVCFDRKHNDLIDATADKGSQVDSNYVKSNASALCSECKDKTCWHRLKKVTKHRQPSSKIDSSKSKNKRSLIEHLLNNMSNKPTDILNLKNAEICTKTKIAGGVGDTGDVENMNNAEEIPEKPIVTAKPEISNILGSIERNKNNLHVVQAQKDYLKQQQAVAKRPALPERYRQFMRAFALLFPDFDLSALFLPYACYSNGQLYYRFLDSEPVFMETYSNV